MPVGRKAIAGAQGVRGLGTFAAALLADDPPGDASGDRRGPDRGPGGDCAGIELLGVVSDPSSHSDRNEAAAPPRSDDRPRLPG